MTRAPPTWVGLGLFSLGMAGVVLCFLANAAFGQMQGACGPRADVLLRIWQLYKERPIQMGITQEGVLMELLASPTRTWTILATLPDGRVCMMAAGDNWRVLPVEKGDPL